MVSKSQLRASILSARPRSSAGLTEQLLGVLHRFQPQQMTSFQPMPDEPQVSDFNQLAQHQTNLLFPRVINTDLEFASGEIHSGSFGILEPTGNAAENIDLILVPALAVDKNGNRLGRGKGFYDRALLRFPKALKLAVIFDEELVEHVPVDEWDEKVNGIVTPLRTIIFD